MVVENKVNQPVRQRYHNLYTHFKYTHPYTHALLQDSKYRPDFLSSSLSFNFFLYLFRFEEVAFCSFFLLMIASNVIAVHMYNQLDAVLKRLLIGRLLLSDSGEKRKEQQ